MVDEFTDLIHWSKDNYESLPWRQNRTLYTTLVSEIMLQQTTVGTVLGKYAGFLKKFEDLDKLANATEIELREAWQGLGYYRRAVNLHKAAKFLHENGFPERGDLLEKIPGIGPYTASAIMAIGMDKPALAVDGNLKRVLSRYFSIATPYENGLDDEIRDLLNNKDFSDVLQNCGSRRINEALMDLGREVCRVKNPLCLMCPLSKSCKSFKNGTAEDFPVRVKEKNKLILLKLARFVTLKSGQVLLYKKRANEWLESQWELPTGILSCEDEKLKQYPRVEDKFEVNTLIKTSITKYKIENYPIFLEAESLKNEVPYFNSREMEFFDLKRLPLVSTATEKVLRKLKIL